MATATVLSPAIQTAKPRLWVPRQVLVTPEALRWKHGEAIVERAAAFGSEIVELKSNRLTGLRGGTEREEYVRAKATLAVVVASESARKLQPIPPSADWQFHIAEGCRAHCQYCYLAGSLSGPPVTRVYADLDDILAGLAGYAGRGTITSRRDARRAEGTTFEASCYTDPMALEHLTGSWRRAVEHFGAWDAPVQLRWTTKFDDVGDFVGLPHNGRTRVRLSVNCLAISTRMEGGTSTVPDRLAALRR